MKSMAREKARTFYAKLTEICNKADGERPELQRAKTFVASR